jgi:hypothetical protein
MNKKTMEFFASMIGRELKRAKYKARWLEKGE